MQTWDPQAYSSNARFVSDLGAPVVDLLDPQQGERILDLGCGDGALSRRIEDRGAVVVAVDSSEPMVEAARARGVDAHVVDGHALTFDGEFDAVFSNAALHWMLEPGDVIAGVARALKPGGRFVGEMGGHLCIASAVTALVAALSKRGVDAGSLLPWHFPTPQGYTSHLIEHGFRVEEMIHFPRPTPLPGDIRDWLDTFAVPFLEAVDDPEDLKDEVADLLRHSLRDGDGRWTLDYVRLRFRAVLAT